MKKKLVFGRGCVFLFIVALSLGLTAAIYQTATAQSSNAGGLRLPFESSASSPGLLFTVKNTEGPAIAGVGLLGVQGMSIKDPRGTGVRGLSSQGDYGVIGEGDRPDGIGVMGVNGGGSYEQAKHGAGVSGYAKYFDAYAVYGVHEAGAKGFIGSKSVGVEGQSTDGGGMGVAGKAVGVYGDSASGMAGFFRGKVTITESLLVKEIDAEKIITAKLLSAPLKLFKIDHPLDPAHKYLSHASVESDEVTDFYSGNVTLGPDGGAWVELPGW